MWRRMTTTADNFHDSFANYLDSEAFLAEVRQHTGDASPCVLDIVENFLTVGQGVLACPTHESLLIALITLSTEWIASDRKSISGSALWPDPVTLEPRPIEYFAPACAFDHLAEIHPILIRERFDAERELALRQAN